MTTLLLKASRAMILPGQKNRKLNPARKSIIDFIKDATSKNKSGLHRANPEEVNTKRHFSASDIDFAQYQQNRSLL